MRPHGLRLARRLLFAALQLGQPIPSGHLEVLHDSRELVGPANHAVGEDAECSSSDPVCLDTLQVPMNHDLERVRLHSVDFHRQVRERYTDVGIRNAILKVTDLTFVYSKLLDVPGYLFLAGPVR